MFFSVCENVRSLRAYAHFVDLSVTASSANAAAVLASTETNCCIPKSTEFNLQLASHVLYFNVIRENCENCLKLQLEVRSQYDCMHVCWKTIVHVYVLPYVCVCVRVGFRNFVVSVWWFYVLLCTNSIFSVRA